MINLEVGGSSWRGFKFKKYSNAKDFRLFLPSDPTHYLVPTKHFLVLNARDIQDNWRLAQEHPKLLRQIHDLQKQCDGRLAQENAEYKAEFNRLLRERDNTASHFTEAESQLILSAISILSREIVQPRRRARPYTAVNNAPVKLTYR